MRLTVAVQDGDPPVAAQLLEGSGLDRHLPAFENRLCNVENFQAALQLVETRGSLLWRHAVNRVQGRGPAGGDLSRGDDRPLHWARLQLTKALRQWTPGFELSPGQRQTLIDRLEASSRGMSDEIRFPAGEGVKRILVTGFDPYTGAFDEIEFPVDPRRPNPSGATALALDGTKIKVDGNVVFIESVIFPNRWLDFDEGIVEDALGPFLESGPRQVHALPTLSQAGEAFELEHWNGRYRTGPDNMGITTCCEIDPPSDWPALEPVPQWTESTLPFTEILAAGTGPFPVVHDMSVQEFPLCGNTIVERADGPSAGSCSFAGSGGNFLSNEAPYRATHLRDALGVSIPVGHVHTPNLALEPIEPGDITNTPFESRRASIVEQATAIVHVIALTLD